MYLDGIHFTVRHGPHTDATMILTALGVDLEGSREVLADLACAEEDKDGWSCLLQDLRNRGVTEVDLLVTDGHDGLLAAVSALFPATLRQRCLVHKQRNVMNAIPKREQAEVVTELTGIWKQEKREAALLNLAAFKAKYRLRYPEALRSLCEDEAHPLTFYAFPPVMHRYIRSTNAIESLFSNVRQRTDQIDTFSRVGGKRGIALAILVSPPLPEPCLQLSLHTALQYRGHSGLSTGLDLFECQRCPCNRQSMFDCLMASLAEEQRLSS